MLKDERFWGALLTIVYLGCFVFLVVTRREELYALKLNEVGDFLAGAFGPVAFLWLILGYMQQGRELKLSSEALMLQADELKSSVEQQKELVAVSRDQVQAEIARAEEAKVQRKNLIKPFFVASGGGGSHSGSTHKLNFTIKNLGAPVSKLDFKFDGELKLCSRMVDMVDKGGKVDFEYAFEGSGEGNAGVLFIKYFDADYNEGMDRINVLVDTSGPNPRLKFVS